MWRRPGSEAVMDPSVPEPSKQTQERNCYNSRYGYGNGNDYY